MGQQQSTTNRAGKREYDNFFYLYALGVRLHEWVTLPAAKIGNSGYYFLSLGFVPGSAVLLQWKNGKVSIMDATPDMSKEIEVPTGLMTAEELPERISQALKERGDLVTCLGCELSPWNGEFAHRMLEGNPPKYLAMGMTSFNYEGTKAPFGVILMPNPKGDGMTVFRTWNPENISDVPVEGSVLSFESFSKDGPVQKLVRTWALMENNFSSRHHHDGQPL